MSGYIASGKKDIYAEKMDWFYHNVSCRSAIKAGNKSTVQELMDIAWTLEKNPQIKYCPHGRIYSGSKKNSCKNRRYCCLN